MPLEPGTRLGAYEISALIGSGGMGEVYRARDARLGRDVAVKVVAGLAADAERLRRFEQEARAAAALNHPNIIAVHDVGTADAMPYVVSELLEGGTLRERLHAGPLPVRKAVDAAVQVAHGLAAAHEKGIVHRDLKPENIFLTDDGRVKILDFGLAKLTEREAAAAGVSAVPTVPPDTLPGVVLGTIGYMSPEQVRGRPTDHRSDIFAFGTILYEMLSGRRAFAGDSGADTMTAILKEDPPDLPSAERHIPIALARIVDRCLEKSPAVRFQSAGDLAFALESLTSSSSSNVHATVERDRASVARRGWLPWIVAAVLAVLLAAAVATSLALWLARMPPQSRVVTFAVNPPDGWMLDANGLSGVSSAPLAVAPDGRRVVFIGRAADNRTALWVRAFDALSPQQLPGTEGANSPFWSPDGSSVGFFAAGKIKKVDVSGGPPVTVCDAPTGLDGTWGRAGIILFATIGGDVTPLYRVAAAGGIPTAATTVQKDDTKHIRPSFLPDGRHFVFRIGTTPRARTFLGSLDDAGARTALVESDSTNVQYSRNHVLFMRDQTLMAQRFDLRTLALDGEPFPIVEPVATLPSSTSSFAMFSASEEGTLVYQIGGGSGQPQLFWRDWRGQALGTASEPGAYGDLSLAPDGKRATVSLPDSARATRDIWIVDLTRRVRTRFTFDPAEEFASVWSPDSSKIVFNSKRKGHLDLYIKASDGSGEEELLLADDFEKVPTSWSWDGKYVAYHALRPETGNDIFVIPVTGDRKPTTLLATKFNETQAAFSPDGRWVAYTSNESGRAEVYVMPFGGGSGKWQVSTVGGNAAQWRSDSKQIVFRSSGAGELSAADVRVEGSTLVIGDVRSMFPMIIGGPRSTYAIARDGQRVLVNTVARPQATATPLTVVINWPAKLNK
jgi:Tol biopolymer transport system component